MHRISTDSDYLKGQPVVVDADGLAVPLPNPVGAKPGQVPRWAGTGFLWSWLDQHTNLYDNTY